VRWRDICFQGEARLAFPESQSRQKNCRGVFNRFGVRRFIAALSGEIHFAVLGKSRRTSLSCGYCGPMNWPVQGGDESPHSKSIDGEQCLQKASRPAAIPARGCEKISQVRGVTSEYIRLFFTAISPGRNRPRPALSSRRAAPRRRRCRLAAAQRQRNARCRPAPFPNVSATAPGEYRSRAGQ